MTGTLDALIGGVIGLLVGSLALGFVYFIRNTPGPRHEQKDQRLVQRPMKYCPNCGTGHDCEAEETGGIEKTAVAIARLETTRDIEVARINAGAAKVIAEVEADSVAAELEGVAEGIEMVTGDAGEPDPGDTAPPTIVVQGDDTADDTPDVEEPPEVDPVASGPAKPRSWDDAYR